MDERIIMISLQDKLPQDYIFTEKIRATISNMNDEEKMNFAGKLALLNLKNPTSSLMYAIFLGIFGADRFYWQSAAMGVFKLSVSFLVPFLMILIDAIIDMDDDTVFFDIYVVVWGLFCMAGIIWWATDIFCSVKNTKQHNLQTLLSIL